MADTAPRTEKLRFPIPATGAGADYILPLALVAGAGFVSAVTYIPAGALNGAANPNNRTFRVVNKGAGAFGGGVAATVTMDGTNNKAQFVPLTVPTVAGPNYTPRTDPASNYAQDTQATNYGGSNTYVPPTITQTASTFQVGDVLDFESVHNGTGTADPGGMLEVTLTRAGNV